MRFADTAVWIEPVNMGCAFAAVTSIAGATSGRSCGAVPCGAWRAPDPPRMVTESERRIAASGWSPDDRYVSVGSSPFRVLDVDGQQVGDPIPGFMAEFSRDGRWLTYVSGESGVYETIVRSWPDGDRADSIQNERGIEGTWSERGELFYRLGDRWSVVETATDDAGRPTWSQPRLAFEIAFLDTPGRSDDVTSDGRRPSTVVQAVPDIEDRIHVVSGLFAR